MQRGLIRREARYGGKLENLKEKNYTQRFLTLYFLLLEEFCGRCDVLNFDRRPKLGTAFDEYHKLLSMLHGSQESLYFCQNTVNKLSIRLFELPLTQQNF